MESGNIPKVLCMILGNTFPIMLHTGAQVSVLPLKMAKRFQPPITVPTKTCQCGTYGPAPVTLRGPMLLCIHIAGIRIPHFAPPPVRCDLIRVARLVIDVENRLVWSRRDDWSCCDEPIGPNPPIAVGNSTVQACVQFFEGSFLSVIEEEDEEVDDALLPDASQTSPVDEISAANSEVDGPSLIIDNSV